MASPNVPLHGRVLILVISLLFALCGCRGVSSPEEKIEAVLQETAEKTCPAVRDPGGLQFFDEAHGFSCAPAAGHGTTVWLTVYGSPQDARAAFEEQHPPGTVQEWHGLPLAVWGEDHPSFPGKRHEYRFWLWQADHYVVKVRAFDDTHYLSAPDPGEVSEALYEIGVEHGLFER